MKLKIFILIFCMILLVGTVSAVEWNDKLTYSDDDLKVSWENWWGLGKTIGTVELKSHPTVNYIKKVGAGNPVTMWYDFTDWEYSENGLGVIEFTDERTGEKIDRDYSYVYWGDKIRNVYGKGECSLSVNGTQTCETIVIGTETYKDWLPYNSKDIPKENIRIGIKVEVKKNDYVDGVWEIVGKKVSLHAGWQESWNVNMMAYWKLDDDYVDATVNGLSLTNVNSSTFATGIINNGSDLELSSEQYLTRVTGDLYPTLPFTINAWIKPESTGSLQQIITKWADTAGRARYAIRVNADRTLLVNVRQTSGDSRSVTSSILASAGDWLMVTFVANSTHLLIYINGTEDGTTTLTALYDDAEQPLYIGTQGNALGSFFDGVIDEIFIANRTWNASEILDLYNAQKDGLASGSYTTDFGPVAILNSPINTFNTTNQTIFFNGSVTSPLGVTNISLILDGIFNETNSSGINDTDYLFTKIIEDGDHNWTYESCNINGCLNATTRNFTIDSINPEINVTSPTGIIDFHEINTNLSLNWTVSDEHLNSCWYDYNGTNITVTCLDNQTNINITDSSNKNLTFYVNDTLGNLNSSFTSWDYLVFQNSQTFNVNVFEGNLETFTANITVIGSNSVSVATLFYNGTPTVASFSSSGNDYFLSKIFQIPEVDTVTNITFVWNVQLSGGQSINITPNNQTISSLNLDDCSVNTVVLYNYTIVDEENQTQLTNTTSEINVNILDQSRESFIANFSKLYSDVNPFAVCLNLDFGSAIYVVDSVVRYESIGHVIEYYNILNSTLTNETIPINTTLYDLASADSTEFKISFKGEDFVFVENALIFIDRQYISENNSFKTVELPKTDSEGQTVGHFVRSDVIYNIRVVKDSVLLATFNNIIAFCQDFTIGDCQIVLVATPTSQSTFSYDAELGILFDTQPTYSNTTNAVSFSYSTDDGTSKTVFLEVTRSDIFGNRTICNNTVTSASGTLSCSVDPSIDETNLITKVYVDGKLTILSNIVLDNASKYGNLAYALWFFLTFVFILGFGTSKTEVLIGLVVSIIGAISLGLVRGDIVGIGSAGIWMIVIVLLGIWKLNKENSQ